MARFVSKINTGSESFAKNRADMLALIERLQILNARGAAISEKPKPRFEERGQLTPRERLARLLDPGMPFLTIGNCFDYFRRELMTIKSHKGVLYILALMESYP